MNKHRFISTGFLALITFALLWPLNLEAQLREDLKNEILAYIKPL